jgi:hypothetical protein
MKKKKPLLFHGKKSLFRETVGIYYKDHTKQHTKYIISAKCSLFGVEY